MARAIFVVAFPPAASLAGVELAYDDDGTPRGGYACVGQVPLAETCLALVECSRETLAAMQADERYLFVEEVADAGNP